jgi:uncharacterized protein YeaO (DUF488 family)
MVRVQRVYGETPAGGGARFLVDRLWPRGVKREALQLTAWARDAAPSDELRRAFHHDPDQWPEFRRRYFAELDANPQAWQPLLAAARAGDVVLLYGARDAEHNNAVALQEYLEARLAEG